MRQLRLVGPSEDGAYLVVEAPTGDRFRLPIDERLRAACRGDLSRLGQLEIDNGTLRPREIQFRVRAGESAEQVAASAGVALERVLRFAYPVLQERERVVAHARETRIRRPGAPPAETLDELVNERLVGRGTDAGSLSWDAWRREDGTWTVCLRWFGVRDYSASWTFELAARTLHADDPAAEQLIAAEFHLRTITPVTPLAAAASQLGPDPAPPGPPPGFPTRPMQAVPAMQSAQAVQPAVEPALPPPPGQAAAGRPPGAVPDRTAGSAGTRRATGPASRSEPESDGLDGSDGSDGADGAGPVPIAGQTALPLAELTGGADSDEQDPDEDGEPARRAHVPSWDDILLGVRRRH